MLNHLLAGQTEIRNDIKDIRKKQGSLDIFIKGVSTRLDRAEKDVISFRGNDNQTTLLPAAIGELQCLIKLQKNRLVNFEDRSRRNNLVIFGLNEPSGETAESLKNMSLLKFSSLCWK